MTRIALTSPRLKARIAGIFYLLAMLTGIFASFFGLTVSTIGPLEWHPHGVDVGGATPV
jgi:hypothetical protein